MNRALAALALLALLPAAAGADEVVFRGNYYRDRNTRVVQPEALLGKDLPTGWTVGAHYLLDTITSASLASGASSDKPFTELRNEAGATVGKHLGPLLVTGGYSFSQESDYRAQTATLSGVLDLFQRNTQLGLALAYGHDSVFQRMGPANFIPVGSLDSLHLIGSWTQVAAKTALFNLSYDLGIVGFGSNDNGYQGNPYRPATVGGMPQRETVPFQRIRNALAGSVHVIFPTRAKLVPYVAVRPAYRLYWDDWGLLSHTVELRTFLPIGPIELRATGRIYTQGHVSFWNEIDGKPMYVGNAGLPCTTCLLGKSRRQNFDTADPKLGTFDDFYFELRVAWRLTILRRLSPWLSEGLVEMSYGHLFNDNYAHTAFGDADLAGLSFAFPL